MTDQPEDVVVIAEPKMVNFKAACKMLGDISEKTLRTEMFEGRIYPQKIRGKVVFSVKELERYAEECPSWEPGAKWTR